MPEGFIAPSGLAMHPGGPMRERQQGRAADHELAESSGEVRDSRS
ncbi:MAG TPA: hypothetical protein VK162_12760 [Streptosporangiaceae bacterium]|nr:hypothetical protein [Streptosporangiaceae bacterium]